MRGIDAVVLWIVCGWNRCSEPSQALRASSPGGRAKGLVGIDGWSVKFRFVGMLGVCTQALASPSGRGTSRREGERDVQTVRVGMQFVRGIGAVGIFVGWSVGVL